MTSGQDNPGGPGKSTGTLSSNLVWKIAIPVAIGIAVVIWLFYDEFNPDVWRHISFTPLQVVALALAVLAIAFRDFGFSWRFRLLTDSRLSWWQAIRTTLLCEFTSCITPSTVGGSTMGMFFLHSEGIALGKSTALMMATLFLDELFFVLTLPPVLLFIPYADLFGFGPKGFSLGLETIFWIVYAGIVIWTAILFIGIFIKPRAIGRVLVRLFSFRLLKRWQPNVIALADDLVTTGRDLRSRSLFWWFRAFAATAVSWFARFLMVNALFLAFAPAAGQLAVFGRQFVVWLVLMISPTPGGSGLSEWLFTNYYGDMISNDTIALVIAAVWRLLSYYIYLIIGAFLVPSWIARYNKKRK